MKFYAANESAFWGYPLCKILFNEFRANPKIELLEITQITIDSPICDLSGERTVFRSLEHVRNLDMFQNQSAWRKVRRNAKLLLALSRIMSSSEAGIFYTTSVRTLAWAAMLKRLLKSRHLVCFHYYEAIDFSKCPRTDRLAFAIVSELATVVDIILVPEQNRLEHLFHAQPSLGPKLLKMPNTASSTGEIRERKRSADEPLAVLHVGAVSEGTYGVEVIDAVVSMQGRVRLVLVGFITPSIQEYVQNNAKAYVTINSQVPHCELKNFYQGCDAGLVLYRPDTLNTKFAAPNKLYEFWSYGRPVLGPASPGLQSQFTQNEMGILVDMASPGAIISGLNSLLLYTSDQAHKLKALFDEELSAHILVAPIVRRMVSDAEAHS